jgi:hypothetical protein
VAREESMRSKAIRQREERLGAKTVGAEREEQTRSHEKDNVMEQREQAAKQQIAMKRLQSEYLQQVRDSQSVNTPELHRFSSTQPPPPLSNKELPSSPSHTCMAPPQVAHLPPPQMAHCPAPMRTAPVT